MYWRLPAALLRSLAQSEPAHAGFFCVDEPLELPGGSVELAVCQPVTTCSAFGGFRSHIPPSAAGGRCIPPSAALVRTFRLRRMWVRSRIMRSRHAVLAQRCSLRMCFAAFRAFAARIMRSSLTLRSLRMYLTAFRLRRMCVARSTLALAWDSTLRHAFRLRRMYLRSRIVRIAHAVLARESSSLAAAEAMFRRLTRIPRS